MYVYVCVHMCVCKFVYVYTYTRDCMMVFPSANQYACHSTGEKNCLDLLLTREVQGW